MLYRTQINDYTYSPGKSPSLLPWVGWPVGVTVASQNGPKQVETKVPAAQWLPWASPFHYLFEEKLLDAQIGIADVQRPTETITVKASIFQYWN